MKLEEAKKIILNKHPDLEIVGGIETDDYYVFATIQKGMSPDSPTGIYGPSVNKHNGSTGIMSIFDDLLVGKDRRSI